MPPKIHHRRWREDDPAPRAEVGVTVASPEVVVVAGGTDPRGWKLDFGPPTEASADGPASPIVKTTT
ncbi:MAG: hypothetical protein MUC88_26515, partial [Planctomycetes bacterium]|nr:hypothetical protein [Planctomycetota bacterium]